LDNRNTIEQLEIKLQAAEEALKRCERLAVASRYAGAIMHEVNNPLEALTNLVFLTREVSDNPELVRENMAIADRQLSNLGNITRKTLSFYRDQAELKDFDLVDIAESALKIHAERARKQRITVHMKTDGPAFAPVFASEILQILSNFIVNSFDAAPEEGGVLCVRVRTVGDRIHVTVADNGSGMDERIYKNIFTPHNTSKAHGTGLGIWLSRGIAEKHGGCIGCRSSAVPGKSGTTFRLTLPASKVADSGFKLVKK
jgi:signal transduction histidine kinase